MARPAPVQTMHTSGIYADMTIDGPEIGTLVVVVDRAKNLPNLKTMGKQDPYCAARLGKEAKKTETDKRGGQTPRWDQELRFTVHDSADYYNLKVSVFNDDKKTDLIGETWINLENVIVPGGGQGDSWHNLTCKGRYAGDIRIELTYYDTRPKLEERLGKKQSPNNQVLQEEIAPVIGPRALPRVTRRPLPAGPSHSMPSSTDHDRSTSEPPPERRFVGYPTQACPTSSSIALPDKNERLHYAHPSHFSMSSSLSYPRAPISPAEMPAGTDFPVHPLQSNRSHGGHGCDHHQQNTHEGAVEHQDTYHGAPRYGDVYNGFSEYADNGCIEYADDPYALQAVGAGQDCPQSYESASDTRHLRNSTDYSSLTTVSARHTVRSMGAPHSDSSPLLGPPEYTDSLRSGEGPHKNMWLEGSFGGSLPTQHHNVDTPRRMATYDRAVSNSNNTSFTQGPTNQIATSLRPVHSYSLPLIPSFGVRFPSVESRSNPPRRPMHVSTSFTDLDQDIEQTATGTSYRKGHQNTTPHDFLPQIPDSRYRSHDPGTRRWSEDPTLSLYENAQRDGIADTDADYGARSLHDTLNAMSSSSRRHDNNNPVGTYVTSQRNQARPSTLLHSGYSASSPTAFVRNHGSREASPLKVYSSSLNAFQLPTPLQSVYTARKSINSSPASHQSPTPYSPDSYSSINPQPTRVSPLAFSNREPSPMYSSPPTSSPQHEQEDPPQLSIEGPIIGPDGRLIDPSDHLPLSSYAPEPERKGEDKRLPAFVSAKTRFGPRDARPVPITSHSLPIAKVSSPELENLGGSLQNTKQTHTYSPFSEAQAKGIHLPSRPPVVPAKVPLEQNSPVYKSGFGDGIDDYEPGGNMVALSQELAGIDIGPGRGTAGGGARIRRSRFGA